MAFVVCGYLGRRREYFVQVYTLPDSRVRLTPFVCVVNSDVGILEGCREVLREVGVKYRDCLKPISDGDVKGSLDCKQIRIDRQAPVEMIVKAIIPYLRSVKKQNAKVVLEYIWRISDETPRHARRRLVCLRSIRPLEYLDLSPGVVNQTRNYRSRATAKRGCPNEQGAFVPTR
jgi:hypothetical protein